MIERLYTHEPTQRLVAWALFIVWLDLLWMVYG